MTPIEKLIEKLQAEHDFFNDDRSLQSGLKIAIRELSESLPAEREVIEKTFSDGYSLAMQEVGEKDREIERLKGLIEKAYNLGGDHEAGEFNQYQTFNDFKTKHNI